MSFSESEEIAKHLSFFGSAIAVKRVRQGSLTLFTE